MCYLLSSDELFWCARRGKSIELALFIGWKAFARTENEFLTNFVKKNVEKKRIWDKSNYTAHWRLVPENIVKYFKWMFCYADFLDITTYILIAWLKKKRTILATLSKHAKTSNASLKSGIEACCTDSLCTPWITNTIVKWENHVISVYKLKYTKVGVLPIQIVKSNVNKCDIW